jgi:hypothetical protein
MVLALFLFVLNKNRKKPGGYGKNALVFFHHAGRHLRVDALPSIPPAAGMLAAAPAAPGRLFSAVPPPGKP